MISDSPTRRGTCHLREDHAASGHACLFAVVDYTDEAFPVAGAPFNSSGIEPVIPLSGRACCHYTIELSGHLLVSIVKTMPTLGHVDMLTLFVDPMQPGICPCLLALPSLGSNQDSSAPEADVLPVTPPGIILLFRAARVRFELTWERLNRSLHCQSATWQGVFH